LSEQGPTKHSLQALKFALFPASSFTSAFSCIQSKK